MPCEHCRLEGHTLTHCVNIDMVSLNQQYNEKAGQGRIALTLFLNRLPVPSLKRLTRELGGVMSQIKRDLVRFCLVRVNPILRRAEEIQGQIVLQREWERQVEQRRPAQEARFREGDAVNVELRQPLQPYANIGERSIVLRMMLTQVNRLILTFTEHNPESRHHVATFSQSGIDLIVSTRERGEMIEAYQIPRNVVRVSAEGRPFMSVWAQTHSSIRSNDLKRLLMRVNSHIPVFTPEAIDASCVNIENKYWNDWYGSYPGNTHYVTPLPRIVDRPIVSTIIPTVYRSITPPRPVQARVAAVAVSIQKGETEVMEEVCCICMESQSYIKTNCGHVFCNCILHHLVKNGVKCPMCRQDVATLVYSQPSQYESTLRIWPLISSGNIHF
jgi:hypothetical protein